LIVTGTPSSLLDLKPQPQMVDNWTVSDDKLVYRFTLRGGLKWHDGQPVRAIDCVASLERWGKCDPFGQKLMESTEAIAAEDDKTFTITLKAPFPMLLVGLPPLPAALRLARRRKRTIVIGNTKCVDPGLQPVEVVEDGTGHLDRRQLPPLVELEQGSRRSVDDVAIACHDVSWITGLSANRRRRAISPSACPGMVFARRIA
jgi:hypothetical protein